MRLYSAAVFRPKAWLYSEEVLKKQEEEDGDVDMEKTRVDEESKVGDVYLSIAT